jgi:hypothetical protein
MGRPCHPGFQHPAGAEPWAEAGERRRRAPPRGVEETLRLGDLASKSVSGGTLVLPGEGGHTHALLDGGCRGLGVFQGRIKGAVGRPRRWRDTETSRGERRWRRRVWAQEACRSWGRAWPRGRRAARCQARPLDQYRRLEKHHCRKQPKQR